MIYYGDFIVDETVVVARPSSYIFLLYNKKQTERKLPCVSEHLKFTSE